LSVKNVLTEGSQYSLNVIVSLDVEVKGADSFIVHNFVIASNLAKPYYIGFCSALNYHGLSDQIPSTTFIATTQAKKPLRILDVEYHFARLERNKFFGIMEIEIEDSRLQVSDPEKTIVDCLNPSKHAGGIDEVTRSRNRLKVWKISPFLRVWFHSGENRIVWQI
jgi:predicted transcriptional regulator of viral defense system